jgi:hypothetical protein
MPRHVSAKIRNLKNLNKFKKDFVKMETDQSSDEKDDEFFPISEAFYSQRALDETDFSEDFIVRLFDLVSGDSSIRNMSIFPFGILTKLGINISAIGDLFRNIGLQKAEHCRDNIIKFNKYGIDIKSGWNRFSAFNDGFPEIEIAAKVSENCSKKSCSFRVIDLC